MKMFLFVVVAAILAGVGGCTSETNFRTTVGRGQCDRCGRPMMVAAPEQRMSMLPPVIQQPADLAPVTVASAAPIQGELFLESAWLWVKGTPKPAPLTIVWGRIPEAVGGKRAYIGDVPPNIALPANSHLIQVELNNNGKWVKGWALAPNLQTM